MQAGDVPVTWADGTLLQRLTGYAPQTAVPEGVARFVSWFRGHYGLLISRIRCRILKDG